MIVDYFFIALPCAVCCDVFVGLESGGLGCDGIDRWCCSLFTEPTGWLVGRLTSPFSTKMCYIGDKVLGGHLLLPG